MYIKVNGKGTNIGLIGLQVWNNSAIKFYDKISTLRIFQTNYNYHNQFLFKISLCSFYDNHGGYNMLSYAGEGEPPKVMIDHCTFLNNNYSNALLKFEM